MIGKWNLSVNTPFGDELYTFDFFSDKEGYYGIIGNEKGFLKCTNIKVVDHKFISWKEKVTTPIEASVKLDATVEGNLMFGSVQIDEYLKVNFEGVLNESI